MLISIKKISLKGSEIIMGGSIIIFIDIRIEVIIRLMIKKGRYRRKLILKVCFSLEIMNVGIRMDIFRLLMVFGVLWLDSF